MLARRAQAHKHPHMRTRCFDVDKESQTSALSLFLPLLALLKTHPLENECVNSLLQKVMRPRALGSDCCALLYATELFGSLMFAVQTATELWRSGEKISGSNPREVHVRATSRFVFRPVLQDVPSSCQTADEAFLRTLPADWCAERICQATARCVSLS